MPPSATARQRRRPTPAADEQQQQQIPSTPPRRRRINDAGKNGFDADPSSSSLPPTTSSNTNKSPLKRAIKLVKKQLLYRPKIPIFSSAFVLAIIFIIAPYVDKTYHKISEEGRVASDLGDVGFDSGKFTVRVRSICFFTISFSFCNPRELSFLLTNAFTLLLLLFDAVAKHGANAENHAQESQILLSSAVVSNHGNVVVHRQETVFNARERAD